MKASTSNSIVVLLFLLSCAFCACNIYEPTSDHTPIIENGEMQCALNELRYLSPPMDYTLYFLEFQRSGDHGSVLSIPDSVTIPEDVILLVGFWRNEFADGRLAERHAQWGHVVKSSVMYHIIDPKTDLAALVYKESREEFFENNPGMQSPRCGELINLPYYGKTYIASFCEEWDYCNPPKTAFLNNMIVATTDGQERFISLPME